MQPKKTAENLQDLFQQNISQMVDEKHPLVQLEKAIDWRIFEQKFGTLFKEGPGKPPKPIRLMVGLIMLQHMWNCSDERLIFHWAENPYWQYFCGQSFYQFQAPINPCTLSRFRDRIGPEGARFLLQQTIEWAVKKKSLPKSHLRRLSSIRL